MMPPARSDWIPKATSSNYSMVKPKRTVISEVLSGSQDARDMIPMYKLSPESSKGIGAKAAGFANLPVEPTVAQVAEVSITPMIIL